MAPVVRHGDPRKDMFFKLDPLMLDWATGNPVLFMRDASKLKGKASILRRYQEAEKDQRSEDQLIHELRRGIAQTLLASKERDHNVQWEPIHQSGISEVVLDITARQLGHSGTRLPGSKVCRPCTNVFASELYSPRLGPITPFC